MRLFSILFLLTATLLVAEDKKRLVFSDGPSRPSPSPTTAQSSAKSGITDPAAAINRFFESLKADQLEVAYGDLVKNTIISAKPENVQKLKEKTLQAIDTFGPIKGYDVVENLEIGKSLVRTTCLSLNEDLPLRWRFYFYRNVDQWRLVDLRVDDGIVELFEDVARNRKK
jgi:hypothetical protein